MDKKYEGKNRRRPTSSLPYTSILLKKILPINIIIIIILSFARAHRFNVKK